MREARSELLLKLVLTQRAGLDVRPLAAAQLGVLDQLVDKLAARLHEAAEQQALVLRFRLAQARATRDYVGELLASL